MAGGGETGPEIALIEESVANATARVRFFRVAFGHASPGASMGRPEVEEILADLTRGGRIAVDWRVAGDVARDEVKLAFLLVLCFESALAFGGRIEVSHDGSAWHARARHDRLRAEPSLWALLGGADGAAAVGVTAAQAQFLLAPAEAARQGRQLRAVLTDQEIVVTW